MTAKGKGREGERGGGDGGGAAAVTPGVGGCVPIFSRPVPQKVVAWWPAAVLLKATSRLLSSAPSCVCGALFTPFLPRLNSQGGRKVCIFPRLRKKNAEVQCTLLLCVYPSWRLLMTVLRAHSCLDLLCTTLPAWLQLSGHQAGCDGVRRSRCGEGGGKAWRGRKRSGAPAGGGQGCWGAAEAWGKRP